MYKIMYQLAGDRPKEIVSIGCLDLAWDMCYHLALNLLQEKRKEGNILTLCYDKKHHRIALEGSILTLCYDKKYHNSFFKKKTKEIYTFFLSEQEKNSASYYDSQHISELLQDVNRFIEKFPAYKNFSLPSVVYHMVDYQNRKQDALNIAKESDINLSEDMLDTVVDYFSVHYDATLSDEQNWFSTFEYFNIK